MNIVISFLVAFITTWVIYGRVLRFARRFNVLDTPDARKVQKSPVPVLGGVAVFIGIAVAMVVLYFVMPENGMIESLTLVMAVMLAVGTFDDIKDISPTARFIIEILVVLFLMYWSGIRICNFYGLWGYGAVLSAWIYVPLTIVSAVGIMNAINLIDGVDGYSSGFCTMASIMFGIMFYMMGNQLMTVVAAAAAGALIPFFMHNVFGFKSKMFIGDGGTLLMGAIMSIFVLTLLSQREASLAMSQKNVGLVPFALAVLSIPVFDTLRVMLGRIIKGKSPFRPDKTHLHHLYLELGFSHVGISVGLVTLDALIVAAWFLSYKMGATISMQLVVVVALAFLSTFVFYPFVRYHKKRNSVVYRILLAIGEASHYERKGFWAWMRNMVDAGDK
ncbi:MAG: undecaprenyl/decaprenyl-phosphate alpha-N-acetylglucosaminyl 1-phosphate transferase [Salinivirgaceae bacterium]|nr:undecaprenyl/decaprenyl-phosphate alpha-N-acetylglucosaminyl 1-phosphate transferase [Salinivirgaceae bacterium]